ncbi:hypothetical protein O181_082812 [Austropuccinia psidii MF-1]|uniref:Uncharacterized protein n=1 Tax=Austropuccinia psidii MF-1 TaxID=1389203 RepID=A0A9Q3FR75_9BASI|nr:hypothetical protein [Austropuccinia psidii MF-1]
MVHTRNRSIYSIQPDRCGQGRGKTRARSCKLSSRKEFLDNARVASHSPRSVPTNFDVNSEPELIEVKILRAEPLQSGSNRNTSVPIQKLVQRSKIRGLENMPKPLEGGHELLLTHQELSGSGEDHRALRRVEPIVLQRQEGGIGNDSSFGERTASSVYQLQTSSRSVQRQAQRTSEEAERSQKPSRKGKRKSQLAQTLTTGVQNPQIGAFISRQCLQYGQDSYGVYSQGAGKDEKDFSTQIIQEIQLVKTGFSVELGKIDTNLTKITLDINDLQNNNKHSSELHKSTIAKLELISNTSDRIERKYQVQDD